MDTIQKINRDYYDSNAEKWSLKKTASFFEEKEFARFIKLFSPGDTIIDIGCGHGRSVPLFLGMGYKMRYYGIDISKRFLKIAERRYPQLPFQYTDITDAKTLPRKKFDGFWANASLQHIPFEQWPLVWKNIKSISKRGAIGYVNVPNDRMSATDDDPRHFTLLDDKTFRIFCKEHNIKILKAGEGNGSEKTNVWRWYIVQV